MLFKRKTQEQKQEEKNKKRLLKAEEKEREAIHYSLIERDILSRKEEKIAPSDYIISLNNINKVYPNHVQAVYDFNLNIKEGEFIVLVGPSGCGKSTTLRMIAGLEDVTCGDLFINGKFANDIESKDRDIAMVFQNYALYPNMTVYENMGFSLLMHHHKKEEIDQKVHEAAKILGLTDLLKRKPAALSGGQRQRVALGRAIVRNSKIFLMDEPLSHLDAKLRVQMRSEIVNLHKKIGSTTIYVTHDQTEAMTMADRIVVMSKGYIQQIGTQKEIYNHPSNLFVATFIGSPAMNILKANYDHGTLKFNNGYEIKLSKEMIRMHDQFYKNELSVVNHNIDDLHNFKYSDDPRVEAGQRLLNENKLSKLNELKEYYENIVMNGNHEIDFGVRPEDIYDEQTSLIHHNHSDLFSSKVLLTELLGNQYFVHSQFGEMKLIANMSSDIDFSNINEVNLCFNLNHIHLFDIKNKNSIF